MRSSSDNDVSGSVGGTYQDGIDILMFSETGMVGLQTSHNNTTVRSRFIHSSMEALFCFRNDDDE